MLVLSLLTLAVAAAVGSAASAYNLAPAEGNARFGSADHALEFEQPDVQTLASDISSAEQWFGAVDVIGRRYESVPGQFEPVEFRVQDPNGRFSSPMLGLVEGRYPTAPRELAATDGVAGMFAADLGGVIEAEGGEWTVVGVVENPSDLNDEFALVGMSEGDAPDAVTFLVAGSEDQLQSFRPPSGASAVAIARPANEDVLAVAGVFTVASVVMLLVSLVAAVGFVVIAQRRLRQLGMLAAIGATEKHLRLVMVANGAGIGAMAAVVGTSLALFGWVLAVPS
jgi:putative ABC transport system permease protein